MKGVPSDVTGPQEGRDDPFYGELFSTYDIEHFEHTIVCVYFICENSRFYGLQ